MSELILKTDFGKSRIYVPGKIGSLQDLVPIDSTVILADANVLKYYSERIKQFPVISIPPGEESKSLESYAGVFQKMLDLNVDRSWYLVGIGGGITTDLAGFVASTFFRGIRFGFVSSTLLGQVDAAIGGKNGINYKGFKNLIGIIQQPEFVLCDTSLLKTLPKREFIGGFAEIIKYAFIRRDDLYLYLLDHLPAALDFDEQVLEYLVRESVRTKLDIVTRDEFETGERKLLNFGHTFGHALEKLYGISHGEAVSIGMMMAAKTSNNLGMIKSDIPFKLEDLLLKAGLPVWFDYDAEQMAEAMSKDKKRKRDGMHLVLLQGIGNAVIGEIPINDLKIILNDLR